MSVNKDTTMEASFPLPVIMTVCFFVTNTEQMLFSWDIYIYICVCACVLLCDVCSALKYKLGVMQLEHLTRWAGGADVFIRIKPTSLVKQ